MRGDRIYLRYRPLIQKDGLDGKEARSPCLGELYQVQYSRRCGRILGNPLPFLSVGQVESRIFEQV